MVEHQPRLLGFRVRFPAGAFAIFSVSAKASLPIVVISIEPVRYATYVYLPMCSTRSGRPLLATSGPPSSLLLVLDRAPRVRLLSVAPYSSSFIMY